MNCRWEYDTMLCGTTCSLTLRLSNIMNSNHSCISTSYVCEWTSASIRSQKRFNTKNTGRNSVVRAITVRLNGSTREKVIANTLSDTNVTSPLIVGVASSTSPIRSSKHVWTSMWAKWHSLSAQCHSSMQLGTGIWTGSRWAMYSLGALYHKRAPKDTWLDTWHVLTFWNVARHLPSRRRGVPDGWLQRFSQIIIVYCQSS